MSFNLAKWLEDTQRTPVADYLASYRNDIREASLTAYGFQNTHRNRIQIDSDGRLRCDFPLPPGHPFLELWQAKVEEHFKSEVMTLESWATMDVAFRGFSKNPEDCSITVVIGLQAGQYPRIGAERCKKLIERLQRYLDQQAPGAKVEMEEVYRRVIFFP